MSVDKLFVFNRPLPPPLDKLTNKKRSVCSKYGSGTAATLNPALVKAVHALCRIKDGSTPGALGRRGQITVAEYKSSTGPDDYHLAIYDPTTGTVSVGLYNTAAETIESYTLGPKARDGAAIFMAMLPELLNDEEFNDHMVQYNDEYIAGFPDVDKAADLMAMLCDNAYRRIKDDLCLAHIQINIDVSGNIMRLSTTQIDAGAYMPDQVIAGEFIIFAQTGPPPILARPPVIEHRDFIGKYILNEKRVFSAREQSLIPAVPPWYIVPEQVVSICRHALSSTVKGSPMRNFLLRGPAGTGKTMGAQAIAAGLGLPYMKYTCSANTEIYDFVGQVFPDTQDAASGDPVLDAERKQLKEMGGITYANVAQLLQLPDLDGMDYDPVGVYRSLTGQNKADADSQACMALVLESVTEKVRQLCKPADTPNSGAQSYVYVETDFIRALKYGYLVEVQEPSTIMQPGVLVGLNSLLEQTGSITLPTGEVVQRHPDAVVVVTTNIDYEGCRGMNQSVLDRMNLVHDVELPPPEIMAQRAMSVTGCEDDYLVSRMVQVVNDAADFCRKNGVSDGACGMRSLIDWLISTEITGDPYTSALFTVISKATADEADREALISAVLEPIFSPPRRKAV